MICPKCNTKAAPGIAVCENCGEVFSPEKKKKSPMLIIIAIIAVAAIAVAGFFTNWFGLCGDGGALAVEKNFVNNALYLSEGKIYYYDCDTDANFLLAENVGNQAEYFIMSGQEYTRISDDGKIVYYYDNFGENGKELRYRMIDNPGEAVVIDSGVDSFRLIGDDRVIYLKGGFEECIEYDVSKKESFSVDPKDFTYAEPYNGDQYIFVEPLENSWNIWLKTYGKNDAKCIVNEAAGYIVINNKLYYTISTGSIGLKYKDYVEFDIDSSDPDYSTNLIHGIENGIYENRFYDLYVYGKEEALANQVSVSLDRDTSSLSYSTVNYDFTDKIPLSQIVYPSNVSEFIESKSLQGCVTYFVVGGKTKKADRSTLSSEAGDPVYNSDKSKAFYYYSGNLYEASVKNGKFKNAKLVAEGGECAEYFGNKLAYCTNIVFDNEKNTNVRDWYFDGELVAQGVKNAGFFKNGNYYYCDENADAEKIDDYYKPGTLYVSVGGKKQEVKIDKHYDVDFMTDGTPVYKTCDFSSDSAGTYEIFVWKDGAFVSVTDKATSVEYVKDDDENLPSKVFYFVNGSLYVADDGEGKLVSENVESFAAPRESYYLY